MGIDESSPEECLLNFQDSIPAKVNTLIFASKFLKDKIKYYMFFYAGIY